MSNSHNDQLFQLEPTPQFEASAAKLFVVPELMSVADILSRDPFCGVPVDEQSQALLKLKYPPAGRSQKGYAPIIIYCVNEPKNKIVLIDVIRDQGSLSDWLANPSNGKKIAEYSQLIIRIIWGVVGE